MNYRQMDVEESASESSAPVTINPFMDLDPTARNVLGRDWRSAARRNNTVPPSDDDLPERKQRRSATTSTRSNPCAVSDEYERAQRIARGDLDVEDLGWLSKGFAAYLAGGGALPLERCLHLPGKDSALRRASRNYWLRRAWDSLGEQFSPWRRSEELAMAIREFESRQWPLWRNLTQPPRAANVTERALFHAFRSHKRIPLTAMQLHNIAVPQHPK